MELDVGRLPDGARLDADLCIIGAGPAGLAVAHEFSGLDIRVLLLESGSPTPVEWPQTLNEGAVVGDAYVGLRPSRHRQVGGTARVWNTPVAGVSGAKFVPLDPWDFEPRTGGFGGGWPLDRSELDPFYRRAQALCRLGPFAYDATDWPDPARPPLPIPEDSVVTRIYQFGTSLPFTETYPRMVRESANVRLGFNGTVTHLVADGGRVTEARIGSSSGAWQTVRARAFVLATGAIETPRLLLASGLGGDLVGRCFMEHLRDNSLTLLPRTPELFANAAFYDRHVSGGGTVIGGRLALSERALREHELPNASLTLLPRPRPRPTAEGFAARLVARLRDRFAPPPQGGYGWSLEPEPDRVFDAFRILINVEQRPNPENRVTLGPDRDALGVPRPVLHWRWGAEEQAGLTRLRGILVTALEAAGVGRVVVEAGRAADPNAHHHAGTTRMDRDPRSGVVDRDGRVHRTDNLFVAGASIFPTAGFANPTLTVVALALRLADHLKAGGAPWLAPAGSPAPVERES